MSENLEQTADVFVVEPVTQLDGSPVPHKEEPGGAHGRERLEQPGAVALAEGLALLCCFLFPWLHFPDLNAPPIEGRTPALLSFSGWSTALGLPIGSGLHLIVFVHLWLVPLIAAALLVLALLWRQRRFSTRLALGILIALSALALLVEFGFYMQVFWLKPIIFEGPGQGDFIGVEWGFWAAVVVNVAAIAASAYLLWRASHSSYAA
jgi:hypothetical protein